MWASLHLKIELFFKYLKERIGKVNVNEIELEMASISLSSFFFLYNVTKRNIYYALYCTEKSILLYWWKAYYECVILLF